MIKTLSLKIIISVVVCAGLGALVGIFTSTGVDTWFQTINLPSWQPPNWLFGPVWTVLYILMGIAFALIWHSDHPNKNRAMSVFALQFIFNLAWSFIFFNLHATGWALVEIIFMLLLIIWTIIEFYKINKTAAYLLMPYLAWVTFATVLNGTIWSLN